MTDYTELIRSLRNCSNNRCTPCDCGWFNKYQVDESCKEIIMWKAAAAIEALEARLGEAENSVERWKDMYLTKHEPKRGKKYPMRCPNCSTVVGVMEVQDGKD